MKFRINGLNGLKYILISFTGIVSTMPIVGVSVANRYVTLFTISFFLLLLFYVWNTIAKGSFTFKVNKYNEYYLLFLIWPILSYFVGIMYMPSQWYSSMTSYVIKVVLYLGLAIMIYLDNDKNSITYFARGLFIGICINAIWSVFEAFSWYILRFSLNDTLFGRYINIGRELTMWNSLGGGIRVCGLNYDPAHLGGLLPIMMCYGLIKNEIHIVVLAALSLAFSQSTTALIGCLVAFVIALFVKRKKDHISLSSNSLVKIGFLLVPSLIVIVFLVYSGKMSSIVNSLLENITGYLTRITTVYVGSKNMGPRGVYYSQAFERTIERGPVVALFGSGLGTSMYPYRNVSGLFASGIQNTVTEIETNYIAYLFDLGVIGLLFYIILLLQGFIKLAKMVKNSQDNTAIVFFSAFVSIILCSATYHYIFTAYHMLTFSFATLYYSGLCNIE